MKNVVIGCLIGDRYARHVTVSIFLRTIKQHITDADIVLFCNEISEDTARWLTSQGVIVAQVPQLNAYTISFIRGLLYYTFLCEHHYENVLCTDVGDVLFQANPFAVDHNDKFWFVAEGIPHGVETFNTGEYQKIRDYFQVEYDALGKHVVNSSIQYGPTKLAKHFVLLKYNTLTLTRAFQHNITNQGILNYLYHNCFVFNPDFGLFTPDVDTFCCHGVCEEFAKLPPIPNCNPELDSRGIVFNTYNGKPYIMMHQWNRRLYWPNIIRHHTDIVNVTPDMNRP